MRFTKQDEELALKRMNEEKATDPSLPTAVKLFELDARFNQLMLDSLRSNPDFDGGSRTLVDLIKNNFDDEECVKMIGYCDYLAETAPLRREAFLLVLADRQFQRVKEEIKKKKEEANDVAPASNQ